MATAKDISLNLFPKNKLNNFSFVDKKKFSAVIEQKSKIVSLKTSLFKFISTSFHYCNAYFLYLFIILYTIKASIKNAPHPPALPDLRSVPLSNVHTIKPQGVLQIVLFKS